MYIVKFIMYNIEFILYNIPVLTITPGGAKVTIFSINSARSYCWNHKQICWRGQVISSNVLKGPPNCDYFGLSYLIIRPN